MVRSKVWVFERRKSFDPVWLGGNVVEEEDPPEWDGEELR